MLMVSLITRFAIGEMAAVPAGEGAGDLDIPHREIVALRTVSVTSAFEAEPSRRQDCEEIRKPSSSDSLGAWVPLAGFAGPRQLPRSAPCLPEQLPGAARSPHHHRTTRCSALN